MIRAGVATTILLLFIFTLFLIHMQEWSESGNVNLLHVFVDSLLVISVVWLLLVLVRRDRVKPDVILLNEVRFDAVINSMPDYVCFKDQSGRVLEMNEVARSLFVVEGKGQAHEVQLNERYYQSFCGCSQSDEEVLQTGKPLWWEESFSTGDGSIRCFDVIKVPLFDTRRKRKIILVIGRDVTSKKQAEDELKRTKEQLESFLQQSPDALSVIDLNGNVLKCNHASERIFGYSIEEVLGKQLPGIPPHLQAEADYYHQEVLKGKQIIGLEVIRHHKDGTPLNISLSMSPIVDAQGRVVAIAGSARDITEQKRVEKRLRESEAKYRLIAENMTDMISVIRTDGTFSYASPSHQQILGYPEHVYYDKSCINLIHPDDRKRVKQDFDEMKKSKSFTVMEYRVKHSDGHWVDLESRFKPVLNRDGEIVSYLAVSRDVTQHKRTEELLRQSDKLSAIGQLAAGIAHEIRNPLTALRGFIQLMKSSKSGDVRYCEIMLAELDRINFIVSELLMLAKPQVVKFQLKDMQEILQNVLSLLDTQAILNNIQIHTRLAEKLPPISCEENQIKQVFINILKNAIEAMPQGGVITMEGSVREDGNVLIRISDSGCGINPDQIPKLGEPFYTTKEKGTGLGLMVSYKIIENHGGSIAISSVINQGTTVDVVLPAAAKRMEKGVLAVV